MILPPMPGHRKPTSGEEEDIMQSDSPSAAKGISEPATLLPVIVKDFWEYTPTDSGGSGTCIPSPSGLVSWWAGDRTADDLQGTNSGRLLNGASFTKGVVGPGFLFDGINEAVRIPNSTSLSQPRFTLDAWVYPTGRQGLNRHIIDKDHDGVTREYSFGTE